MYKSFLQDKHVQLKPIWELLLYLTELRGLHSIWTTETYFVPFLPLLFSLFAQEHAFFSCFEQLKMLCRLFTLFLSLWTSISFTLSIFCSLASTFLFRPISQLTTLFFSIQTIFFFSPQIPVVSPFFCITFQVLLHLHLQLPWFWPYPSCMFFLHHHHHHFTLPSVFPSVFPIQQVSLCSYFSVPNFSSFRPSFRSSVPFATAQRVLAVYQKDEPHGGDMVRSAQ